MSKVKFDDPVLSLRGKICKHANTIYKEMYGEHFTSRICNLRTNPYDEDELALQAMFKQAVTNAKAELAVEATKAEAQKRFMAQKKTSKKPFKTLRGMVIAEQYAILKAEAANPENTPVGGE